MWAKFGQMWANVGRCGEMWGNVGKCGKNVGKSGQIWANVGICGLIGKLNPLDYPRMMPIGLMYPF